MVVSDVNNVTIKCLQEIVPWFRLGVVDIKMYGLNI